MKKKQDPSQSLAEPKKGKFKKKSSSQAGPQTESSGTKLITIDIENYRISEKPISLKPELEKFQFTNQSYFHPDNNVKEVAQRCFQWIFNPLTFEKFTESYMNKKIVILKRSGSQFGYNFDPEANCLFSWTMVKQYLRANDRNLEYGGDLDVVKYIKQRRATINPRSSFDFNLTMDLYHKFNASIRILRPHQISDNLMKVIALFEEIFVASGGANAYITPKPNINSVENSTSDLEEESEDEVGTKPTQGFAPHYDDVDTFILQIEGTKYWKLHKSPSQAEVLAINPSKDFNPQTDLPELIWEGMLQQGDLLYMPRGIVHHANTVQGQHSLHVTLSNQHHTSWGQIMKQALNKVMDSFLLSSNPIFRQSVPPSFLQSTESQAMQKLVSKVKEEISSAKFLKYAKESLSQSFQHCRQNPLEIIKEVEEANQSQNIEQQKEAREKESDDEQEEFESVKLLSLHAISLIGRKMFYSTQNTKIYQEVDSKCIELDKKWKRDTIELIRRSYPTYLSTTEIRKKVACEEDELVFFLKDLADKHILIVQ